ncbi:MAG: hypothetical protein J5829_07275 [Lachnospiraceae bacterium]|nr:hypothetical protein [Lachnospiraceae bacterium]
MRTIVCRKCNRIFDSLYGFSSVCPQCAYQDEEDFKRVKSFVWDHPGVTIDEVSEICGVTPKDVREWLREERLSLADGTVADVLTCMVCGKPILKGRFCDKCKAEVAAQVKPRVEKTPMKGTLVTKPETEDPSKMRFLDSVNKKNQ